MRAERTQNGQSPTERLPSRSINLNKTSTNAISANSLNDPKASLISYSRVMHQHTQRQMATISDADRNSGIGKDNHSSTSDHNHQTHETSSTIIAGDGHSQEQGCAGGVSS